MKRFPDFERRGGERGGEKKKTQKRKRRILCYRHKKGDGNPAKDRTCGGKGFWEDRCGWGAGKKGKENVFPMVSGKTFERGKRVD